MPDMPQIVIDWVKKYSHGIEYELDSIDPGARCFKLTDQYNVKSYLIYSKKDNGQEWVMQSPVKW